MLIKRMSYGVKEVKIPAPPIEEVQTIEHVVKQQAQGIDEQLIKKIVEEVLKKLN